MTVVRVVLDLLEQPSHAEKSKVPELRFSSDR
jgi:hypothetical protein